MIHAFAPIGVINLCARTLCARNDPHSGHSTCSHAPTRNLSKSKSNYSLYILPGKLLANIAPSRQPTKFLLVTCQMDASPFNHDAPLNCDKSAMADPPSLPRHAARHNHLPSSSLRFLKFRFLNRLCAIFDKRDVDGWETILSISPKTFMLISIVLCFVFSGSAPSSR